MCCNKFLLDYFYLVFLASSPPDSIPVDILPPIETLEIIAQPCYTSKLRYRSEYQTNKNRRGNLHSQNNPNYQSPAIRVSLSIILIFPKIKNTVSSRFLNNILMLPSSIISVSVL